MRVSDLQRFVKENMYDATSAPVAEEIEDGCWGRWK